MTTVGQQGKFLLVSFRKGEKLCFSFEITFLSVCLSLYIRHWERPS